ncbi:kinase-like protein [Trametes polyzona]|nr:kinase-like protein [Trametes polyzona]
MQGNVKQDDDEDYHHEIDKVYISSFSVCGIYQATHSVGSGQGGRVLRAFNINTGCEVAIKRMPRWNDDEILIPTLAYEATVYKLIPNGTTGFPRIHYAGRDANDYVIVMDRLGPSLAALRRFCRGRFALRTICMLAHQMLERIEFLHTRGIVHCDIKPQNFAMGFLGDATKTVHIFDLGFAKTYLLPRSGEHIAFQDWGRHAIGTIRYASIAAHKDHPVSRRDDIESLFYVLLEFYHGTVPWKSFPAPSSEKQDLILEMKEDLSPTGVLPQLLARSPPEFAAFHAHVVSLEYGDEPDYALLTRLFQQRMRKEGWSYDGEYDWIDPSGLEQGTLVPEEYVPSMRFVEEKVWNPYYM